MCVPNLEEAYACSTSSKEVFVQVFFFGHVLDPPHAPPESTGFYAERQRRKASKRNVVLLRSLSYQYDDFGLSIDGYIGKECSVTFVD
jgi:hypothetical protein